MLGFSTLSQGALSQVSFNALVNAEMSGDVTSTVSAVVAITGIGSGTASASASNSLVGVRARTVSGSIAPTSVITLSAGYIAGTEYADIPGESALVSITPQILFEGDLDQIDGASSLTLEPRAVRPVSIDVLQSTLDISLDARKKWEEEAEGDEIWTEVAEVSDSWTVASSAITTWSAVTNDANVWTEQSDATNTWTEVQ